MERDCICCYIKNNHIKFQLTRSRGAWRVYSDWVVKICISTHTLTWSVTLNYENYENWTNISTHTLTWSVTKSVCQLWNNNVISTHTLTWSVTIERVKENGFKNNFNSHAHVERDYNQYHTASYLCHFNSHAHVERDVAVQKSIHYLRNFNSHAHVERDKIDVNLETAVEISTHTLTWSVTFS